MDCHIQVGHKDNSESTMACVPAVHTWRKVRRTSRRPFPDPEANTEPSREKLTHTISSAGVCDVVGGGGVVREWEGGWEDARDAETQVERE